MKNIFLTLAKRQIFILLFLVGPLVSQGVIHKNEKFSLNQTIVFEIFEAIKNGDSKNYEGLFYELAANLESPGEFRRLLSMTDERGNNIFHLMASVPLESPAFSFFQHEIMNLLIFLTLPERYYNSLSLNPPSFGGMTYSEMPKALQLEKGSMSLRSVIRKFLEVKNKEGQTPHLIAKNNPNSRTARNLYQLSKIPINADFEISSQTISLMGGLMLCSFPLGCGASITQDVGLLGAFFGWLGLSAIFLPVTMVLSHQSECHQAITNIYSSLKKSQ